MGLIEAALTVSAFEGLNRVADATGIELDDSLNADSADLRKAMNLQQFAGSANTERTVDLDIGAPSSALDLFGGRVAPEAQ